MPVSQMRGKAKTVIDRMWEEIIRGVNDVSMMCRMEHDDEMII
jgi:hypothetical protein